MSLNEIAETTPHEELKGKENQGYKFIVIIHIFKIYGIFSKNVK